MLEGTETMADAGSGGEAWLSGPSRFPPPIQRNDELVTALLKSAAVVAAPYRYVPRVPQEILDLIVDNMDDKATLQTCSVVCWAFVHSCRKRLFRDLCFMMSSDTPDGLYQLFLCYPHLASYVQSVTIYRLPNSSIWMRTGSLLPALLGLLTRVTKIALFGCWGDWLDMAPSLASALLRIVSSGALERLHLLTVTNVPAPFLRASLTVPNLSMFHVGLDSNAPDVMLPRAGSSPEFLNLSLDSKVGKILEFMLQNPHYFSNVRRLAVNPIPHSINSSANLALVLSAVQSTLERLDIQWHELHIDHFDKSRFDYSRLTCLRTIQLHIVMEQHTLPPYLPWVLDRLRASNPRLTSLAIVLHLPAAVVASSSGADPVVISKIDALLGGGEAFPALQDAHITVIPESSPPSLVPDYVAFFAAHLPKARRRGVLRVEQGWRKRGEAVMPLLPYIEVWPHRKKG
ncbi:glyceraldehyde-3-phosphate dehydrogenase [Favolaschia claudopus]|uniref:Glyceraldehyde-3-phosphate dehydrogenase n=1 Tax=Favolaschia claudopus TaxID=2862362 RepID=A0AAW0DIV4_9AGAR